MCQMIHYRGCFERPHSGAFLKDYLLLHSVKEEVGRKEIRKQVGRKGGGKKGRERGSKEGRQEVEMYAVIVLPPLDLKWLM